MKDRLAEKFVMELCKIREPEVFAGVARILKVPLVNEKGEARDFNDVLGDTIEYYVKEKKKRKKELLLILKDANKCEEEVFNGNNTKDSAEAISDKEV